MDVRCYCVFEGGGAKGIAHVGALAACEEAGLDLRGYAGTSAGAVIAALAAVGYSSKEMIHDGGTILDLVDLDKTNVWGGIPHRPVGRPGKLFGPVGWTGIRIVRKLRLLPATAFLAAVFLLPTALGAMGYLSSGAVLVGEVMLLFMLGCLVWFIADGIASLSRFEAGLNQLMRLKLAHRLDPSSGHRSREPIPVTFADLQGVGCPPLKIVASDITRSRLRLFSVNTTPTESVAAAVAASVCLPAIFKPVAIGERLHLDGGLVSNLPAWTFDSERAMDRDAWTAVVGVGEPPKVSRPRGIQILFSGVKTALFGASILSLRNVERMRTVRLKVELDLLQFDPGHARALEVALQAKTTCQQTLLRQIVDVPKQMDEICRRIAVRANRRINQALRELGKSQFAGRIRASILTTHPEDDTSLLAEYHSGFSDCPDERIRLPKVGSFAGKALMEREPLYLEARDAEWNTYLSRPEDRWLRKAVWSEMQWVLCIPYIHKVDDTVLVVSIDSNAYADLNADLLNVVLSVIVDDIRKILRRSLPSKDPLNGIAQAEFTAK